MKAEAKHAKKEMLKMIHFYGDLDDGDKKAVAFQFDQFIEIIKTDKLSEDKDEAQERYDRAIKYVMKQPNLTGIRAVGRRAAKIASGL